MLLQKCSLKLAVFDFDYTILNANSTNYLNKLVIERLKSPVRTHNGRHGASTTVSITATNQFKYEADIEALVDDRIARLNAIFVYMHDKHGIGKTDMVHCLRTLSIGEPMKTLMEHLKHEHYDIVIISDSNTFVIETILEANGLLSRVTKIFTNVAEFNEKEHLHVVPLNKTFNENGQDFNCPNEHCRKNICKGAVLEAYIASLVHDNDIHERSVLYVGDGLIDYCPGLKLTKDDRFFIKKDSRLANFVREHHDDICANIVYWKSATDILVELRRDK